MEHLRQLFPPNLNNTMFQFLDKLFTLPLKSSVYVIINNWYNYTCPLAIIDNIKYLIPIKNNTFNQIQWFYWIITTQVKIHFLTSRIHPEICYYPLHYVLISGWLQIFNIHLLFHQTLHKALLPISLHGPRLGDLWTVELTEFVALRRFIATVPQPQHLCCKI